MRKLIFSIILLFPILITGCKDNMDETIVLDETNVTTTKDCNVDLEVNNYFQKLDSINKNLIKSSVNSTRGKAEDIGIVAADAYGAYIGAQWGWKNGKGLLGKAALSVGSAVVMAVVCSFMAAVHYNFQFAMNGTSTNSSIIPFNQNYIEFRYVDHKNDVLNSMLTAYEYRLDPQKWMEEHPDMEPPQTSILLTSEIGNLSLLIREENPEGEDSEEENPEEWEGESYLIDAHMIACMHNDALSYLIKGNMCDVFSSEVLELYNIEMLDSQIFDTAMSNVENEMRINDNWWLGPSNPLEFPLETMTLTDEQQLEWCDHTIHSYLNGLSNISFTDSEGPALIRELAGAYINTISGASFITDINKIILFSSITVSAYSCDYWSNYDSLNN